MIFLKTFSGVLAGVIWIGFLLPIFLFTPIIDKVFGLSSRDWEFLTEFFILAPIILLLIPISGIFCGRIAYKNQNNPKVVNLFLVLNIFTVLFFIIGWISVIIGRPF